MHIIYRGIFRNDRVERGIETVKTCVCEREKREKDQFEKVRNFKFVEKEQEENTFAFFIVKGKVKVEDEERGCWNQVGNRAKGYRQDWHAKNQLGVVGIGSQVTSKLVISFQYR